MENKAKSRCETCNNSEDIGYISLNIEEEYIPEGLQPIELKDNFNKYFGERTKKMHQCFKCQSIFTCLNIDDCTCHTFSNDKYICYYCYEDDKIKEEDILERF